MDRLDFGSDFGRVPDLGAHKKKGHKRMHEGVGESQRKQLKQTRVSPHKQEFNVDVNKRVSDAAFTALLKNMGPEEIASGFSDMKTLKKLYLFAESKMMSNEEGEVEEGRCISEKVKERVGQVFFEVCKNRNAFKAQRIANEFENFNIENIDRFFTRNDYSPEELQAIEDVTSLLKAHKDNNIEQAISNCSNLETLKTVFIYSNKSDMRDISDLVQRRVAHLFFEECKCRNTHNVLLIAKQFNNFDMNVFEMVEKFLDPQNYSPSELKAIKDVETVFATFLRGNVRDAVSECSDIDLLKTFYLHVREEPLLGYLRKPIQQRMASMFFDECKQRGMFNAGRVAKNAELIAREFKHFDIDDVNQFKIEENYTKKEDQVIEKTMHDVQIARTRAVLASHHNEDLRTVVSECSDLHDLMALYAHAKDDGLRDLADSIKQRVALLFFDVCKYRNISESMRIAKLFSKFEMTDIHEVTKFLNQDNYTPEEFKAISDVETVYLSFMANMTYSNYMRMKVSGTSDIELLRTFYSFASENNMYDIVEDVQNQVATLFLKEFNNDNMDGAGSVANEFRYFDAEKVKEFIFQKTNKQELVEEFLRTIF